MSSTSLVNANESQQDSLRTLLIAMLVLPTITVVLRVWSRAILPLSPTSHIKSRFWWDDWAAFAGAALNIVTCGIGLKLVDLGLGLHIGTVPPENIEPFLKLLWIEYFIFDTGTVASKSSALFFYSRTLIVSKSRSRLNYSIWLVHFLNAAWLVSILVSVICMCDPIEKAWKPSTQGRCLNTGTLWMGSGISSLIIDVFILMLPLPVLWRLQMKTSRKLQISGVFICGYLVVVVSIGRLATIVQAGSELELDPTYRIATPVLWLGSEIAISIVSVSLPSLFFLGKHAHRHGARALFSRSISIPSSRTTKSHHRINEEDSNELFTRSADSYHDAHVVPTAENPNTVLHSPYTSTTARFDDTNDSMDTIPPSGIFVRNDVSVK